MSWCSPGSLSLYRGPGGPVPAILGVAWFCRCWLHGKISTD